MKATTTDNLGNVRTINFVNGKIWAHNQHNVLLHLANFYPGSTEAAYTTMFNAISRCKTKRQLVNTLNRLTGKIWI